MDVGALLARQAVEATLGVPVELYDSDGRQGVEDLRWTHDGALVACEVKLVVNEAHRAAQRHAGEHHRVPGMSRYWMAHVTRGAPFRPIARALPAILPTLEARGTHEVRDIFGRHPEPVVAELDALGVSLWSLEPT